MAVGEALRRLCEEIGWSYAVFWKAIGAADPVHLVWEDGCCGHSSCLAGSEASEARSSEAGLEASGNLCSLVKKVMVSQVHVVGEGIVGRAAFTGNHRWIVGSAGNDDGFERKAAAELNYQFQAGIQTIAIIPVLPRGVLQLGSTSVVMENTAFVLHAKKLCSQLNNRSSMAVSASVKNEVSQQGQPHTLHGVPSIRSADTYSKVLSGFPMAYEQCRGPDTTAAPSSISTTAEMDASLLNITQQNSRAVREHFLFSKPDVRFIRQAPYWDGRLGSNTQSVIMSSGFTSSSLAVVENQSFLTTSIGQLESGNSAESEVDLPRNVLLTSAVCQGPVQENTNIIPLHGTDVVSDFLNCNGNFDFLPSSARVVRTSLYNVAQVLERRHNSTSGASLQKQPLVPCKVPRAAQFALKMENPERESFQAPAASSSEFDVQVSCSGLSMGTSQENQLSRSNLICHDKRVEVNDSIAAVSMQGMKNMDGCKLPDVSNERSCLLPLEPTTENDLFDILGPEFHQLCRNVDADLFSWNDARTQISDRDAPESSMYVDTSQVFDSLDNELPYSRTSLTDTDQLLDAVISNINLGGKQNCDDSASCKTSLTDMPSTSYVGSKELKQCGSSGVPSLLVKNELAVPNFVKQPCFFDRAEDGCLSQNNGMQKSQIRLWIESGQNMKCESGSASNSKGLDTPNKANRKRSRSGENPRPRPKDRQLIQDRIKELREIVPNGAKCSTDALLEKTIKHMLFLQSVTKHADKLKDSTESKILGGENGPLWKDYFEGGVTWAFEVGSQSMTCPIIVEDLDRPRQMLVEILCEDRGIFLEIADFIRGLGLTILRGVMEARKSKIWARFTVEANRDVTRMEIFLSLVRLLEPNCGSSGAAQNANNVNMPLGMVHQPVIPATGISDCLR